MTELPRLSRLQRVVNKKVALEYGYEYPYVPESVMQEVEENRQSWCEDEIWEYLGVPRPCRTPEYPKFWENFLSCKQSWSLGRHIYKDKVVVVKAGRRDQVHTANIYNKEGRMVEVPDPYYYR